MLRKQKALILTFDETVNALAWEKYCGTHGLPGRLIPVPREITAGCGLAWKAPPEAEPLLLAALHESRISFAASRILEV